MSKRIIYIAAGVLLAGVAAFAYYALSPLFINVRLDEALPAAQPPEGQSRGAEEVREQTAPSPVIGTPAHPASGHVRIVEADGKRYVRYENYKTINGPDIYVYLAKDIDAKEFVDLGRVKATEGNVNYEIPDTVQPDEYRYVLTWCRAFGVLFNYADLALQR